MNNIRAIIWDLDKTLYPFDEAFGLASQRALATMIAEMNIGMSPAQALSFARPTYPMQTIARLQREYGLAVPDMFSSYYNNLDAGFLQPSPDLLREIGKASVTFGILSHCNRNWADRALAQLGLSDHIPPHYRVTCEDLQGQSKDDGPAPFRDILARMKVSPQQAVMVEDKDKNLKFARQLGMKTVFVTNGDLVSTIEHADHIHQTGHEFMQAFNRMAQHKSPISPVRAIAVRMCE